MNEEEQRTARESALRDCAEACLRISMTRRNLARWTFGALEAEAVWWKWEHAEGDTLPVTQEGVLARLSKEPTPPL